jgi:hypothetical protein
MPPRLRRHPPNLSYAKLRPMRWPRDRAMWMESSLLILNIIVVLLFTRHLFQANSLALFWGYDGLTVLTFIEEQHRFSSTLFGLGSDPVIGLGNIAFPIRTGSFPTCLPQDLPAVSRIGHWRSRSAPPSYLPQRSWLAASKELRSARLSWPDGS